MSSKRLYLKFVEKNVQGTIDMYWDNAPVTCRTIWDALEKPIRVPAMHAMFSGPEIMMGLPKEAQNFDPRGLPPENQSCFPAIGELLWFYQAPNLMKGLSEEFWEVGMFYGEGGRIFGPLGFSPCTFFARMTDGLEDIAKMCGSIRVEGIKTVELGRLS